MAKLNEKQKVWTVASVGLGVCLIAGGGVYWAKGLIEDERKAIEAQKNDIAAAEQKIAKIVPTEREVIILRENLDEYVKVLPNGRDLNVFVKVLTAFASQSQVHPTNVTTPRTARTGKSERFSRIEYQYDMTATLWQFMRFINSIENYERFISITNFSITSGATARNKEEQRDGDYVHEIKLTMETYTYNGSGSGQDVEIPNYTDKRNDLREAIFKNIQNIRYDKYDHKGGLGRRDLFVDPRNEGGPATGVPLSEQKGLIDQATADLKKLSELWARFVSKDRDAPTIFEKYNLEKSLRDGLATVQSRVDDVNAKNLISNPTARRQWQQKVVEPLASLKKEFDGKGNSGPGDLFLGQSDMEQLLVEMKRDLEAGNLEDARGRFESVQGKLGVPATDKRHELVVQATALHLKTVTAIEFTKLDLKIQGVLVNHDGRSGVLLNGEVYEEGEYISDELLVKQVQEEQVQFVYRGLTLVRTL